MAARPDIREVKEKTDIIALVSRYVTLTRSGASYKGRCPFHKDDTPSFVVSSEKGLWHCFGCGEGGDVVSFLMKIERLTFGEAARRLAADAGLSYETESSSDRDAQRLLMADVAAYFASNLHNEREGKTARAYLVSRGYDEAAWEEYGLGYALPGWDHLKRHFGPKVGSQRLIELGLLVEGDKGTYDRFRDRTIFPIYDLSGHPIAFGGRAFDGQPKYLNSPKTPLFDKSRQLYGLSWAREAMQAERTALLVEGYTDVLSLRIAGIRNAVGSMGTSLTQGQADLLGRFVSEVVIAYDRDAAGGAASLRGMQILRNSGLAVRVARFDEGEDPDSLVRKRGADAIRRAVDEAIPFHRFFITSLTAGHDPDTVAGKEKILDAAKEFYRGIRSLPLQHEIGRALADLLDLPYEDVGRALRGRPRHTDAADRTAPEHKWGKEEVLLALLLRGDVRWETVKSDVSIEDFSPAYRPIVEILANAPELPNISAVVDQLDEDAARTATFYALAPVEFRDVDKALEDVLAGFVIIPALDRRLAELESELRDAEGAGDSSRWDALMREKLALVRKKKTTARRGMYGRANCKKETRAEEEGVSGGEAAS